MQIIDGRALLLRVRHPNKITAVIPKSKDLGDNKVLVNWGVDEVTVLKNIGIKNVPAPIMGKYSWPGRFKPFKHQKATAAFMSTNRKGFCFSEQGTGKTASAIWASDFLMTQGKIRRALIVCPLSIMDSAWRNDLFSFAMHRTVSVAYGSADKRKKIIAEGAEYVIINYDGIAIVADEITKGGFDLFIIDEATHYKNPQTTRWKVLNKLLKPSSWVWMMTGTPAAQSPLDAFGLAKIVNPTALPPYFSHFREQVMFKINNFKYVPKPDATTTVHRVLQPAIRFTKDECLDLPEMTYTKRQVELTRQQAKYYKELKNKMAMAAAGEQVTAANAAVNMSKLLQVSCGAVYSDTGEVLNFDISNRYKILREVIDESSQKVLLFVPFKHAIRLLRDKLLLDGISTEVIDGGVTPAHRSAIFADFQQNKDPRVLVIQPQAAAHGVTLTAANTVVWWGPVPSLETYEQANARVHRPGQHHPCTVVQLQGSYVERHVYALLDNKRNVHTEIVDLYKEMLA